MEETAGRPQKDRSGRIVKGVFGVQNSGILAAVIGRSLGVLTALLGATSISPAQVKPIDLKFAGLLITSSRSLKPSPQLIAANGKRVRITGYMTLMEKAPQGGFWLCPRAVFQDESGGHSGELPPNAIFVQVRGAGKNPVAFLAGPLTVTGQLTLKPQSPRIVITLESSPQVKAKSRKGSRKP